MTIDVKNVGADEPETQSWELTKQWSGVWRSLKWSAAAVLALLFLLVIGQGFMFHRLVADIHPILGWLFIFLLAAILFLLVGRPLKAYFSTPLVAKPPAIILDPEAPTLDAMRARLAYDLRYLRSLSRHPDLKDKSVSIVASIKTGEQLLTQTRANDAVVTVLADALAVFEAEHIETVLAPLDAKVDALIHRESVAIGAATAVSMNGTIDAFLVLWRSANMIAKISKIYFGRPNFRGSLLIMRDVASIVVMSRALDDITDITGDLIGSVLGRMGGLVAGPIMDGAVNAMMALKLGYLTKRRCRSFRGWQPSQARSISADALARVRKESGSVINELIKACGGLTSTAAKATESVMVGSRNAWSTISSWFGGKPAPDGAD